jgi:Flp pilus assembly protein TadD
VGLIGNIALSRAEHAVTVANGPRALAQARKARRWAPWSTEALRALGEAEVITGRRTAGLADLRRAARRDPNDWRTWFDIASVASGGEHAAAVAHVRALNPAGTELQLLEHPPTL